MNKIILIGRIGRDAELKETETSAICRFNLATTERFNKDGEKQEITDWHNIVIFGKAAKALCQYLTKGKRISIEGKSRNSSYEGRDGVKKHKNEVIASNIEFLSNKEYVEPIAERIAEPIETPLTDEITDADIPF